MSGAVGVGVVVVFSILAGVVVVLTRARLGGRRGAGRSDVGRLLVGAHTVLGLLALVAWVAFLIAPDDTPPGTALAGVLALAGWWVVTVLGLLILLRWLPTRGRHASAGATDGWSRGPWLSFLAHGGMVVNVGVMTWGYLTHVV